MSKQPTKKEALDALVLMWDNYGISQMHDVNVKYAYERIKEFVESVDECARKDRILCKLDDRIADLKTELEDVCAAKDAEIERMIEREKTFEDRCDSLEGDFSNRETELLGKIADLEKTCRARKCCIDGLSKEVEKKDARIAELAKDVDEWCEVNYINMLNKNTEIAELEKQIPPSYDSDHEYTETELRECMQAACDLVNLFPGGDCEVKSSGRGRLCIISGTTRAIGPVEYKITLQAPAKGRVVMVSSGGDNIYAKISAGELISNSISVKTEPGFNKETWAEWCDILDPSNHSPGWKPEWNPENE